MTEGVTWLDENTALVQRASGSESEHLVLEFAEDGGVEEFPVSDVFDVFAGPGQLILQEGDPYDATTYRVYDLATGAALPLFASDFPTDQYIVNVFGSEQLTVQIAPVSESGGGWEIYVTYEVRFSFDDES
jgi:hypothetical protein